MKKIKCGIMGFGFSFPKTTRSYKEIAALSGVPEEVVRDKFGINKVYYPGNNEQPSGLAVEAAKQCLKNTGVGAEEIDLIIYFGENYSDHLVYSIGPKVQKEIGAVNAWCYEVESKCGSAILAMQQAKMYMTLEPDIKTVLLVAGYRNVDLVDYTDRSLSFLFDVSCGGAACILRKGYAKHNFLSAAAVADGSFADAIVVPGGGTALPLNAENVDDKYIRHFRLQDPQIFREKLGAVTLHNLKLVTERALAKDGYTLKDVDFVACLHMNKSSHRKLFELIEIPQEKSFYLADYGHTGQIDPILALALAAKKRLIKKGDLVAIIGMGFGYIWNGGAIRW
ncbi:MAG: 3-oxoacyl-ACP synthase [Firmicutes bacterium]|nr:3-oxoacyl-ACP synthase [Bacillota bacterium]